MHHGVPGDLGNSRCYGAVDGVYIRRGSLRWNKECFLQNTAYD